MRTLAFISILTLLTGAADAQCTGCPSGQSGDVKIVRTLLYGSTPEVLACRNAGTDFTLNLDNFSGWADGSSNPQDWVIHVYDCASGTIPAHDIGKVTISGDPAGISSLAFLVGSSSQAWTDFVDEPLDPGAIDFGGLEITDPDVLVKARASIAIYGDITQVGTSTAAPDLHANQFVRVQVTGLTVGTTTTGGSIDGNIIAEGENVVGTSDAIGQVRAWHAIRGRVEAKSRNIAAIRVLGDRVTSGAS